MIRLKNIVRTLVCTVFVFSVVFAYEGFGSVSNRQAETPKVQRLNYALAYESKGSELKEYEVSKTSLEVHNVVEDAIPVGVGEMEAIAKETTLADTSSEESAPWWTEEEKKMMEYIIQQEVRGATLKHKRIIAQVIVNRVKSDKFPDTISEVILQENQFSSVDNYYNHTYEPDEDTRQAVREVLNGDCEDLSQGALFFYSPRWASQSASNYFENNLTFLFELEGHRFFK